MSEMERVHVFGASGSGSTTLGAALAEVLEELRGPKRG